MHDVMLGLPSSSEVSLTDNLNLTIITVLNKQNREGWQSQVQAFVSLHNNKTSDQIK